MSEEEKNGSLERLKNDMLQKQRSAENAAYMYACACDLGPEREEAFLIHEKIRLSLRNC